MDTEQPIQYQDAAAPVRKSPMQRSSTMAQWVIRYSGGLIKSEREASYVLIAIALALFAGTIWNLHSSGQSVQKPPDAARHTQIELHQTTKNPL